MTDIGQWLIHAINTLKDKSDTPYLEAQVLLSYHLQQSRTWIVAHPEYQLTQADENTLYSLLQTLQSGMPLPYITGVQEFFGLDFQVTRDVLIPRPETELMIENAMAWMKQHSVHSENIKLLDIGTGSGCISITLAKQENRVKAISTDISVPALKIARNNSLRHHVSDQISFVRCHLSSPLKCCFDIICANLPYIPSKTLEHLAVARYEPVLALDGGDDGLDLIRQLLTIIRRQLSPDGIALLEIEETQDTLVLNEARKYFSIPSTDILLDMAGKPRFLRIQTHEN